MNGADVRQAIICAVLAIVCAVPVPAQAQDGRDAMRTVDVLLERDDVGRLA